MALLIGRIITPPIPTNTNSPTVLPLALFQIESGMQKKKTAMIEKPHNARLLEIFQQPIEGYPVIDRSCLLTAQICISHLEEHRIPDMINPDPEGGFSFEYITPYSRCVLQIQNDGELVVMTMKKKRVCLSSYSNLEMYSALAALITWFSSN